MTENSPLRFGILGAARIAPRALTRPAAKIESVAVTRVAARDRERAEAFASEHNIANVSETYQGVVDADDVDVVYIPLPMNLHAEWTIKALRAGKHVLCEKPFASNAAEAAEMVRVAEQEGRILGEAFHDKYHPMFARIVDVVNSGAIGSVTRAEGFFNISLAQPDLRWSYETSGGSLMDLGCYPLSWLRHIIGEEPTVISATAEVGPPKIDAAMTADLSFPSGATGLVQSSMVSAESKIMLVVTGSAGELIAENPLLPHNGNLLTIRTDAGTTSGPVDAGITYDHMLRAFVDHVLHGTAYHTSGADSIANMAAIDSIYEAAGLPIRGISSSSRPN